MDLRGIRSFGEQLADTEAKYRYVHFEDRRKCLNLGFWDIFKALEKGQKLILVINEDSDLEYLNYFITSYELSSLCLLINKEDDFISPYTMQCLQETIPVIDAAEIEDQIQGFMRASRKSELNARRLHTRGSESFSLLEAYRSLESRPASEIPVDCYRLYDRSEYKEAVQFIKRSENLYRKEFRFNDRFSIFRIQIFNEQKAESLLAILNHFRSDLEVLHEECRNVESQIEKSLENTTRDVHQNIRELLDEAEHLIEQEPSPTRDSKLDHILSKLSEQLHCSFKNEDGRSVRLTQVQKLFKQLIYEAREEILVKSKSLQIQLPINGGEYNLDHCQDKLNVLLEDLRQTQIFERIENRYFSSFYFLKSRIGELKNLLDKAIYFIENELDHLEWCMYFSGLDERQRKLLSCLTEIEEDWISSFETAYLRDYVKNEIHGLESIAKGFIQHTENFRDFELAYARKIVQGHKRSWSSDLLESKDAAISWQSFLVGHVQDLCENFPVLIMNSQFFDQYGHQLEVPCDKVLFVNTLPSEIRERKVQMEFYSYTDMDIQPIKMLEGLELCKIKDIDFNVNRSISYLNASELHKLSLYFARGLRHFQEYRLFQTRNCSIISFLSPENNMLLLQGLDKERIKEIFENEDQNLVSVFFQDTQRKTLLICEDYLMDTQLRSPVVQQRFFLEQIQMAGTELICIDNYKNLRYRKDEMSQALKKILSIDGEKAILV